MKQRQRLDAYLAFFVWKKQVTLWMSHHHCNKKSLPAYPMNGHCRQAMATKKNDSRSKINVTIEVRFVAVGLLEQASLEKLEKECCSL